MRVSLVASWDNGFNCAFMLNRCFSCCLRPQRMHAGSWGSSPPGVWALLTQRSCIEVQIEIFVNFQAGGPVGNR